MRTEVRTVPRLVFVPVPPTSTDPCLVPMPPLNEGGQLEYQMVLPYAAEVLGILEECNIKLECIRKLGTEAECDAP